MTKPKTAQELIEQNAELGRSPFLVHEDVGPDRAWLGIEFERELQGTSLRPAHIASAFAQPLVKVSRGCR